ncbi:hypothetical protein [Candidatus Enterovibrio escicola]|nr:hypothetical protein [Candidatus Enterovibrio escacola]
MMGKGKAKRKISNWKQYNQALVNRGFIFFTEKFPRRNYMFWA